MAPAISGSVDARSAGWRHRISPPRTTAVSGPKCSAISATRRAFMRSSRAGRR